MGKQQLLIFPFNGNGLEALDCVDLQAYDFVGFVDDDTSKTSDSYEIFKRAAFKDYPNAKVLAVPGSATSYKKRADIISSLGIDPSRFINVIHPNASIGRNVKIGYNCLIMAGVVITSNVILQNHICILPNSVLHHDVRVSDYTLIGSNVVIAGGTLLAKNCYVGSGTNVINGVNIGAESILGLGSNVIMDVQAGATMVGNPARPCN